MDFPSSLNEIIEFAKADTLNVMLLTGFIVILALLIANEISRLFRGFKEITPAQTVVKMNAGATLLDVRTPAEYQKAHIVEAINVPLAQLEKKIDSLDKSKTIVVYCGMGQVSVKAAAQLKKAGFSDLFAIKGGLQNWQAEHLPTINAKAKPTKAEQKKKKNSNKQHKGNVKTQKNKTNSQIARERQEQHQEQRQEKDQEKEALQEKASSNQANTTSNSSNASEA